MIFLKVPVGMRKTVTLTMEKTVRGGTKSRYIFTTFECISYNKFDNSGLHSNMASCL